MQSACVFARQLPIFSLLWSRYWTVPTAALHSCSLAQTGYPYAKQRRDCTYTHLIEGVCMQFNWLWMHFFFYCVETTKDSDHVYFRTLFSGIGNNVVLIHKPLWIPKTVLKLWTTNCCDKSQQCREQVMNHYSPAVQYFMYSFFFPASLKNGHGFASTKSI